MPDINDAIDVLTAALKDLHAKLVAAGKIGEHQRFARLILFEDGTGTVTIDPLPTFGHYSKPLAEAFAAAEAYLDAPPFRPGQLGVHRDHPQGGHGSVVACHRYTTDGGWLVEGMFGPATERTSADNYVLLPSGWRDPPPAPLNHLALLELSTDGPLSAEDVAAASAADEGMGGERAAWYRGMAAWWTECGAEVNPELANEQARLALALADEIDSPKHG